MTGTRTRKDVLTQDADTGEKSGGDEETGQRELALATYAQAKQVFNAPWALEGLPDAGAAAAPPIGTHPRDLAYAQEQATLENVEQQQQVALTSMMQPRPTTAAEEAQTDEANRAELRALSQVCA